MADRPVIEIGPRGGRIVGHHAGHGGKPVAEYEGHVGGALRPSQQRLFDSPRTLTLKPPEERERRSAAGEAQTDLFGPPRSRRRRTMLCPLASPAGTAVSRPPATGAASTSPGPHTPLRTAWQPWARSGTANTGPGGCRTTSTRRPTIGSSGSARRPMTPPRPRSGARRLRSARHRPAGEARARVAAGRPRSSFATRGVSSAA